jgi:ribosomal protein S18 acetylase RimI-like enzyme
MEIGGNGEHAVLVAEDGGLLVGWIHVVVSHSLLTERRAEIAGLVVDEPHRSRGIGQALMEKAEAWARQQGCGSVRLHSNVLRTRAHAFYERLGYRVTKLQKAFRKELA